MHYAAGSTLLLRTGIDRRSLLTVLVPAGLLAIAASTQASQTPFHFALLFIGQATALWFTWQSTLSLPQCCLRVTEKNLEEGGWRTPWISVIRIWDRGKSTSYVIVASRQYPGAYRRLQWRLNHPIAPEKSESQ